MSLDEIKFTPILDTLKLEDIDDAVYFSEKYADFVSNSRLSLINPEQGGSVEKFETGLSGNKIYSDSLIFGSAVHELILQPENFELVHSVNRPTAKCGFIADIVSNKDSVSEEDLLDAAYQVDYYRGLLTAKQLETLKNKVYPYLLQKKEFERTYNGNKTLIYLDEKNRTRLNSCLDSLGRNKNITQLLSPKGEFTDPVSMNEKTILLDVKASYKDKEVILRLKSKLDNFTIDRETDTITVNDVKTTGKMVNEFDFAIDTYHYYREMGMYCYLLSLCASKYWGIENAIIKSNFLVVSTIPQYYTKVVPMTKKLFMRGFNEFKYLLKLVAQYKLDGILGK